MEWPKFNNLLEIQKFKILMQNAAIVVLALVVLCQAFLLFSQAKSKRTVIIPSVINAGLEVSDMDASPNFIRTNIFYSLSLIYSYTPETAAARFQEFLISFVEAAKVKDLRLMLSDRLRSIQSVKITESFEAENIIFLPKSHALVKGKVYRYTLGYKISTDALYLKIGYRLIDGNLRINSILTLTQNDYLRLQRQQQLDGKRVEEEEKKRNRSEANAERKEEEARERQDRAAGAVSEPEFKEEFDNGDVPTGSLETPLFEESGEKE